MPLSGSCQCSATKSTRRREVWPLSTHHVLAEDLANGQAVQQFPVAVELELGLGAVANPHRPRAAVALELVELLLGKLSAAIDPVEHAQRQGMPAGGGTEPAGVGARLIGASEGVEGVEGEPGVPQPGVAVVPVAHPADLLGEGGGGGCDHRTGRPVDQHLQRDRTADHGLAPWAVVAQSPRPVPPPAHRGLQVPSDVTGGGVVGRGDRGACHAQSESHRCPACNVPLPTAWSPYARSTTGPASWNAVSSLPHEAK